MFRPRGAAKELFPIVAVVLALYWRPALLQGFFYQRDVFLYWIPQIEWAVRTLAAGRLPQWEGSLGFGMPFLSDPSFQAFYPLTWLNLVLQPSVVFSVMVIGHTLLGAIGTFRLLRKRLRSREAGWVGAISFVAAGSLVSSANLWHHYASAMYMPWIADAFLRVTRGRGGGARLAALAALQLLAGSADVVLMTAFGLAFLLPLRPRRLLKRAPALVGAGVLCFALSAAQWLPTIQGIAATQRTDLSEYDRLYWSVSPRALVDFVLPLTGVDHARDDLEDALEHRFRLMTSMYAGASTLPLLFMGARLWPRGAALLGVSLLVAMGKHGPLSWASDLPIISMVRFPSKALWLFSLCWAALVAIGLAALARRMPLRSARRLRTGGLLLLLIAAILPFWGGPEMTGDLEVQAIWRTLPGAALVLGLSLAALSSGRPAAVAMVVVVALDLLWAGRNLHAYSDGEMLRMRPAVVDVLKQLGAHRAFVLPSSRREARSWKAPPNWSDEEAYFFGQGQMLVPPQGARWGIRGSFDGNAVGLAPRDYTLVSKIVTDPDLVNPRWLQFGGVTHVLQFEGGNLSGLDVMARVQTLHDQNLLVLRVPDPRPPAYLASQVREVSSTDEAIRAIATSDLNLREEIVRVTGSGPGTARAHEPARGQNSLQIVEQFDGRATIRVSLDAPRSLVVLESLSEGWSARVNGRPAEIRPANLLFQSIDLTPGEHVVELRYQTPGLILGFTLSLLTWLGLLIRHAIRDRAAG